MCQSKKSSPNTVAQFNLNLGRLFFFPKIESRDGSDDSQRVVLLVHSMIGTLGMHCDTIKLPGLAQCEVSGGVSWHVVPSNMPFWPFLNDITSYNRQ
jgi:hypothetical protein